MQLDSLFNQRMKIVNYKVEVVDLRLHEPMNLPFGTITSRPSSWVRIGCLTENGSFYGLGEGATLPEAQFTDDSGHNIGANCTALLNSIGGASLSFIEAVTHLQNYVFDDGGRYPTARLGVETSLLDALTKANNTSVRSAIGIRDSLLEVPYGFSIGANDPELLVAQANRAIENNATKIKVKISPSTHKMVLEALKEIGLTHHGIKLMVDANGTYDPTNIDHIQCLEEIDTLDLLMIEEPVSRAGNIHGLDAVRKFRRQLPDYNTDVCLDDCLSTVDDCTASFEEGLAQIINIKPGRIGSFMQSLSIVEKVRRDGGQVMVGGMLEATPGRCMTTLLGAYCLQSGFDIPGDLSLPQERLAEDLVPVQLHINERGNIVLPLGNGWGY